jgi:hypothetical protein
LKTQVQVLENVHSRHIDRKGLALEHLDNDMFESEEQFATALQAHLISIDTLVDLQNSRLETLRSQFEGDVSILDAEFTSEKYMF